MNKGFTAALICILLGVTAFSVYRFVSATREALDLTAQVESVHSELSALEEEKSKLLLDLDKEKSLQQALSSENLSLKDELQQSVQVRQDLEAKIGASQKEIDDLSSKISVVQAENKALAEQAQAVKAELEQSAQEKQAMAAKLSSVVELKKAIKELRRQARAARKRPAVVRKAAIKKNAAPLAVVGNQGFLVKDGKPTFEGRVRINVVPQPPALSEAPRRASAQPLDVRQ